MVILLMVSLGSTLVIGYLSWQSGRNALMQQAFTHLTSLRASKARQIEGEIQAIEAHSAFKFIPQYVIYTLCQSPQRTSAQGGAVSPASRL
jgi:hypothetical protein